MELLDTLPVWAIALLIYCLRIIDVPIGTVRTIAMVNGLIKVSVLLGFIEIFIWILAVSQVISRIHESLWYALAYALGFATGSAIGILIERKLAFGVVVVRMISANGGFEIADKLREKGYVLTTFVGSGRSGPVTLIYITCPRRDTGALIEQARALDPKVFYTVESAKDWSRTVRPPGTVQFWRSVMKKI